MMAVALVLSAVPLGAETLILGTTQVPRHFNGAIQSGIATMMPTAQIFASPLRYEDDWTPRPYLAQSWEVAEDQLSVTLHLTPDATFHDGMPITSADVAFSIRTIRDNHPFASMLAPVTSVSTPDPLTAIIHLAHPHPALLLAMSPALMPILPEHIYGGPDLADNPANLKPVGSGPFRFVEYRQGDHYRLERNPDFFLPDAPRLDGLIVKIFSDPMTMLLSLESGEIDMILLVSGVHDIQRLQAIPGMQVSDAGHEAIGPLNWIAFNMGKPPFDDVRVRQAIGFGIDKRYILDQMMAGLARDALGPIAPGSPFADAGIEPYTYDPVRAADLLDAAGYPVGADGLRFTARMDFIPGVPEQGRNVAEYMKSQLAPLGIALELRSAPDFPTWAQRIATHDFDITQDNVFNWGDPVIGVHRTYLSSNIREGVIWSNTQRYSDAEVDDLLARAATEPDPEERAALYARFQHIVVEEAPILFINELPLYTAARAEVTGLPQSIWGAISPYLTLDREP
ncbi:ABC transporter substrate-binding protein [Pseudooceanicola algae]|uniref:Heme-binding protein A n=1 Tax=Pseudooceanicola algae TaxID=1537215 RepID=A0A418SG07_9RHOB|nr:ABC transporter substrate-binding protein [Pseudooceanicola algae]QPM91559.1 Heme-binding protein A [Pseudooceanicola algae]